MVCGPAGTRRRVYFPPVPVMVLRPMAGIATDTLLSSPPSAARVTVPVTVPVCCAAATAGMARATRTATDVARRANRVRRGADELRRIPGFLLWGEWDAEAPIGGPQASGVTTSSGRYNSI